MSKYTRGWSNVRASRCRAAHLVTEEDRTEALCGSPVRTLVRPKGAPFDICDRCGWAKKRITAFNRKAAR